MHETTRVSIRVKPKNGVCPIKNVMCPIKHAIFSTQNVDFGVSPHKNEVPKRFS